MLTRTPFRISLFKQGAWGDPTYSSPHGPALATQSHFQAVPHPQITISGILGTLNWVPEWYSPKGPATPEQIGDQLADLLLGGLLASPPAAASRPALGRVKANSNSRKAR